jgi:cytochrome c oxidase cbb3-type subunit 3
MGNETDQLKDHAYDGIQEYDNPLPAWWLTTFFITIIFGFLYWIHYEFGGGVGQYDELKQDLAHYESLKQKGDKQDPGDESEETLMKLVASQETVAEGKAIYAGKGTCTSCHGPELGGLIGPNLTDEYWIHGKGTFTDVANVVAKGVLDKGMPNWDAILSKNEIKAVTAFVLSRKGSNPPSPKPPQGAKIGG